MKKSVFQVINVFAVCAAMAFGVSVFAAPQAQKIDVCHFDDDGLEETGPVTLSLGSQAAADKHVANHTVANDHEGDDFIGACIVQ